jgi:hypothetical protein|tara:strand:- start:6454 stop:6666 length:213 start_codon:yes stop_codon:yes gene_type:complete
MKSDNILKVTKAAEWFWLIITIVFTIGTAWIIINDGFNENKYLPLIPALSGLWYVIRRIFRKRLERDLGR